MAEQPAHLNAAKGLHHEHLNGPEHGVIVRERVITEEPALPDCGRVALKHEPVRWVAVHERDQSVVNTGLGLLSMATQDGELCSRVRQEQC